MLLEFHAPRSCRPPRALRVGLPPLLSPTMNGFAELNCDGPLHFFDDDGFVTAFETGEPGTDDNRVGALDFVDDDDFVNALETGC